MTYEILASDLALLTPELMLAIGAMALLMVGVFIRSEATAAKWVSLLTLLLLIAAGATARRPSPSFSPVRI